MTSNNISFLAKSGGHGYSRTLQSAQDVVMLNMEKFNYSRVNEDGTATIGSGATFLDLIRALSAAGREISQFSPHHFTGRDSKLMAYNHQPLDHVPALAPPAPCSVAASAAFRACTG